MPAPKGIRANSDAINQLIEEKGLLIKQLVDPSRRKTLDRARKGGRLNYESMLYLAEIFDVDVVDISDDENRPLYSQRTRPLRFVRMNSLKGFPRDFFRLQIEDMDYLNPFDIEAQFEIDDPSEEQAETAAQLVDLIEKLTSELKPSEMIRTIGKLNSNIKRLIDLGIYLYVGNYKQRHYALPWIDADQTEKAHPVESIILSLIFTKTGKSRSLQREVDLGSSLEGLNEDMDWINGQIEKAANDQLDDEELRFLNKLRDQAKQLLVDCRI